MRRDKYWMPRVRGQMLRKRGAKFLTGLICTGLGLIFAMGAMARNRDRNLSW